MAITYALVPWATWFLSVFPPPASNYAGTVTHVRDGDAIEVNGKPIRIANLDCAELGTDEEAKAHHHILNLAADRNVECHLQGQTGYDRFVGTCRLIGGDDVGRIMVDAGKIRNPAQYDTQNDAVSRNIDHDNQLYGVSRSDGGAIKRRFACYFDEEIGNACLLLR